MVGKVTAQNKTEWNDFQTTHGKRTLVPLSWRRGPMVFSRGRRSLKTSALNIQGWGSSLGSLALGPA